LAIKRWQRIFRHLFCGETWLRRAFNEQALEKIEKEIVEQERKHRGELRFAVEADLPLSALWRGFSPRQRALEVFGAMGVWDTEENSGVLIYLLMADKDVEIVADRGIDRRVDTGAWQAICGTMEQEFAAGRFELGVRIGLQAVSELLAAHFPPRSGDRNELADKPMVM
jgi:hypothetical protein